MSVEVVMPQMGESITEGTVSKWLKSVGDHVDKDEAVLEISTDKVGAEVPSPGEGTLLEIRYQEGDTVEVGTVLAVIGAEGEQPATAEPYKWTDRPEDAVSQPTAQPDPSPAVIEAPAPVAATAAANAAPAEQTNPQSEIGSPQSSVDVIMP